MARAIGSQFTVDTRSLKALAADLEKTVPGIKKSVNVALKEGGAIVAAEARALSSWSSRIPGSIRVAGAATRTVVRAGGRKAPHAAAFEHGGKPGTFRHPVFGNRNVWVTQKARPYLLPALAKTTPEMVETMVAELDVVLREARL